MTLKRILVLVVVAVVGLLVLGPHKLLSIAVVAAVWTVVRHAVGGLLRHHGAG